LLCGEGIAANIAKLPESVRRTANPMSAFDAVDGSSTGT